MLCFRYYTKNHNFCKLYKNFRTVVKLAFLLKSKEHGITMESNNNNTSIGNRNIPNSESMINYKEILDRVAGVQKHFKQLTQTLTEYNAKNTLARDKRNEIGKCLMKYKNVEPFHTTSHLALDLAANIIERLGDHQTAAITRIEKKVISNLSTYKNICKCLKGEVTTAITAQDRYLSKKKLAENLISDPRFIQKGATSDAEKQFANAKEEFTCATSQSQEQVIKFEHKRLMDMKESLLSFFKIEIANHAKSLELLTDGYKFIHSIDENADLEVLKKNFSLKTVSHKNSSKHSHHHPSGESGSCDSQYEENSSNDDDEKTDSEAEITNYRTDNKNNNRNNFHQPTGNNKSLNRLNENDNTLHNSSRHPQSFSTSSSQPHKSHSHMHHHHNHHRHESESQHRKQVGHGMQDLHLQTSDNILRQNRSENSLQHPNANCRDQRPDKHSANTKSSPHANLDHDRINTTKKAQQSDKNNDKQRAYSSHGHRPFESLADNLLHTSNPTHRPYTSPTSNSNRKVRFSESTSFSMNINNKACTEKDQKLQREQYLKQNEDFYGSQTLEKTLSNKKPSHYV